MLEGLKDRPLFSKQTKNRPAIKIDKETLMGDIEEYPDAFCYE
ncbi:hypothetical protein [Candidatus Neptunichlamydia sp. REUL1]|nr:hypothetical protein [Candidatus Neptunochlamydia sp. REUL1]